jgi:hypothetical protein
MFYPIHHSKIILPFNSIQLKHYIDGTVMQWLRRSGLNSKPVHVGFVVNKVALEKILL